MQYTHITTVTEAKAQLSKLLEQVQDGNEVVIGKAGKPIAILSPYVQEKHRRKAGGSWEGKVEMAKDFDELPTEFLAAFGASKDEPTT